MENTHHIVKHISHTIVLLLSLALITYISYDTFRDINFLENERYMIFQFWVCMVFILDFIIELWMSKNRRRYASTHWFYLLISIPYLNIISAYDIEFTSTTLYYIRFIPLVRGAYSLAMVVGYFSTDRALSLLSQYAAILSCLVYLASLIFYYEEHHVNNSVSSYWDALYWACMDTTTVGSYINAETAIGKGLSVILAAAGMMMLPLFTVYITNRVKIYNDRHGKQ